MPPTRDQIIAAHTDLPRRACNGLRVLPYQREELEAEGTLALVESAQWIADNPGRVPAHKVAAYLGAAIKRAIHEHRFDLESPTTVRRRSAESDTLVRSSRGSDALNHHPLVAATLPATPLTYESTEPDSDDRGNRHARTALTVTDATADTLPDTTPIDHLPIDLRDMLTALTGYDGGPAVTARQYREAEGLHPNQQAYKSFQARAWLMHPATAPTDVPDDADPITLALALPATDTDMTPSTDQQRSGHLSRVRAGDRAWMVEGACRGAGLPASQWLGAGRAARLSEWPAAQGVCAVCPVREACRDYAVGTGQMAGVWGGAGMASEGSRRGGSVRGGVAA